MKHERVLAAGAFALALLQGPAVVAQTASPPMQAEAAAQAEPDAASVARPGYMIVISEGVDPAGMSAYARAAVPLMFKYRGKLLFATEEGQNEVLESGPYQPSVRVFEFPSLEAARGYYQSAEYQAAIPLRAGNGKIIVIVADAFVPDPKWGKPPE